MSNRLKWIDIAKGILIFLVVLGHSGAETGHPIFISKLIYWFHMPAFFIISGLLFKPVNDMHGLITFIKKRTLSLIVPFYIFLPLAGIYNSKHLLVSKQFSAFIKEFFSSMLGGNYIGYIFWFITCLYITQVLFAFLHLIFKNHSMGILLTVLFCYLLAHLDSGYLHLIRFPWSANVSLISIYYFAIGFYGKDLINNKSIAISCTITSIVLIISGIYGFINYDLDLASIKYNHIFLDATIPVLLSNTIFALSRFIENLSVSKYIVRLGSVSLVIMYLHFPINWIVKHLFDYGPAVYTVLGIIIPGLLTTLIIERFSLTRRFLLGISQRQPINI